MSASEEFCLSRAIQMFALLLLLLLLLLLYSLIRRQRRLGKSPRITLFLSLQASEVIKTLYKG